MVEHFSYNNIETKYIGGKKIMRKVTIKKGKGYKSITKYHKGKKVSTIKKPIHKDDVQQIKMGKFVYGLFNDCINCKTRKNNKF